MGERRRRSARASSAFAIGLALNASPAGAAPIRLSNGADAWQYTGAGAVRGITIGPIESALHPGKGYGSAACARTMREARRIGASWVSLTPFGRVYDLTPSGVSWS